MKLLVFITFFFTAQVFGAPNEHSRTLVDDMWAAEAALETSKVSADTLIAQTNQFATDFQALILPACVAVFEELATVDNLIGKVAHTEVTTLITDMGTAVTTGTADLVSEVESFKLIVDDALYHLDDPTKLEIDIASFETELGAIQTKYDDFEMHIKTTYLEELRYRVLLAIDRQSNDIWRSYTMKMSDIKTELTTLWVDQLGSTMATFQADGVLAIDAVEVYLTHYN